MKREEHNLDQYFQDGLRDYESPLAANLWDKLDAARDEDKKTKRIIWWKWTLGASLLILLTTTALYFLNSQKKDVQFPSKKSNLPTASIPSIEENIQFSYIPENNTGLTSESLAIIEEKSTEEITSDLPLHLTEISTNKTAEQDRISISNNSLKNTDSNNGDNTSSIKNLANYNLEKNKNSIKSNIENFTKNQIPNLKPQTSKPITQNSKPKTTQRLSFLKTKPATLLDQGLDLQTTLSAPLIKIPFSWGPKGCYSFAGGRINYDFYVDAFISPEYAIRKLTAKTVEYESYRQRRDETESTLFGVSGGLRLSIVTRRGLALRTGIVYNRILERFSIEKEGDTRGEFFVPAGTTDTTFTILTGTTIVRTFNRYHSFDIPLLLGYEIEVGNFNFNINSGVYFNVFARQRGEILSPTDMRAIITTNNPQRINAFEKDFGISVFGSLGFNYLISPGLHLLVEPNIRYQLKPITLESYPLEQQYLNVGVLLGVRRQF